MEISITTPFITLEALLKFSGLAMTGGHAKDLILEGEVRVDGEIVRQRGRKIRPGVMVRLKGHDDPLEVVRDTDSSGG